MRGELLIEGGTKGIPCGCICDWGSFSSGLAFDVRLLTSCYPLMLDMMMMLIVPVVLSVVAGDFLCLLSTVAVFFDDLG